MILADWGANGQNPSKVATSGTAAVYFPRLIFQALQNGQAGGPTGFPGLQAPATPTATNATGQLMLPGSQYFVAAQGQRLRAVASGSVFTAASQTATITVQINTGTLATPAYTTLMTTVSGAFSGRASWVLEAHFTVAGNASLAADSQTSGYQANFGSSAPLIQGQLSGWYEGAINNTISPAAPATIGATTNAVILAGTPPLFNTAGLVVNVAFSVGTAGNNATLNEFAILGD
jgi:hypothetical protein